jgi:glycosyltransferase involved in cell wall biosynthesis/GT2 family glycosyltransferase
VSTNELNALKQLGKETNDDVITFDFKDIHPTSIDYKLPDLPLLIDYITMGKLLKIDLTNVRLVHMYGGCYSNTIQYLKYKGIITSYSIMWHDRNTSITEHQKFMGKYPFIYVEDDTLFKMYADGIRYADVVIAAGSVPRNNMLKEGAKRVEIIPLGCDIPNENQIKPFPNEFRVGYLGACILPESPILTLERGIQKIKDIKIGDKVLTHKGKFKKVSNVMNRPYEGDIIKIIPSNIRSPIFLTPEHKVLAVRTSPCIGKKDRYNVSVCRPDKKCYWTKPNGMRYKNCKYIKGEEPFAKYKTEWIEARNLRKGDFVTYPKANEITQDIKKIKILDWIDDILNITTNYDEDTRQIDIFGNIVQDKVSMNAPYSRKYANIPIEIDLTKDLMRLFGYFIAEGDISDGRRTRFSFHINETDYHKDVEKIMKDVFGLDAEHEISEKRHVHRLGYSNKVLSNMFQNMFVPLELQTKTGPGCKANIVKIPSEFLNLPLDKLAELIKGEWRGDGSDYDKTNQYNITTTSETLAHQLIYILSKFGIFASLKTTLSNVEGHEDKYDVIISSGDNEIFENIIGEKLTRYDINHYSQTYLKGKKLFYVQIRDIDIISYNGDVWNLDVEEDNSYVSYISLHNCGPDKGLVYLIKAWELLNYRDGSKLVFAGPNSEYLNQFIIQHSKTGNYHIMGYVRDVADFYNSIGVYIQPSATEGFSIEVPESMSYERPVICSDGAGAADLITNGEDGFVVPKMNPEAIAEKIQYFKNNPSEIIRMGRNAREKSFQYTWKNTKYKYIELWRELLKKKLNETHFDELFRHDSISNSNPITTKKKICIVIITLNSERFYQYIDSIFDKEQLLLSNQPDQKMSGEIIIVQDIPSQERLEYLDRFSRTYGHTIIINPVQIGGPKAFNQGIRLALSKNADYLFLTNDDCILKSPNMLITLSNILDNHPEYGYISPAMEYEDNKDNKPLFAAIGECTLHTRESIERVGLFDESPEFYKLGTEIDYYYKLNAAGYKPHGVTEMKVKHFVGSTIKQNLTGEDCINVDNLLIKKWGTNAHRRINCHILPIYDMSF